MEEASVSPKPLPTLCSRLEQDLKERRYVSRFKVNSGLCCDPVFIHLQFGELGEPRWRFSVYQLSSSLVLIVDANLTTVTLHIQFNNTILYFMDSVYKMTYLAHGALRKCD